MTKRWMAIGVLCVLGWPGAAGFAQENNNEVDEILERSGIKQQIERVPVMIQSGLETHQEKSSDLSFEDFDKLVRIITDSYEDKAIYQSVVDYLLRHQDQNKTTALLDLLRSPVAMKMSRLENRPPTPEDSQALIRYARGLDSRPPTQERVHLVMKLYHVAGTPELSIQLQTLTLMGTIKAFNAARPLDQQLDREQLRQLRAETQSELEQSFKEIAGVIYLYTYRTVSDEEIEAYIELLESDVMRWFTRSMLMALMEAMNSANDRVEHLAAKTFRRKNDRFVEQ
jgi:hypothetical protein